MFDLRRPELSFMLRGDQDRFRPKPGNRNLREWDCRKTESYVETQSCTKLPGSYFSMPLPDFLTSH